MIVVAIIAILAVIVLPSYSDYVLRGKIPEATSGLAAEQVQMEQYFQDNKTYVSAPGCSSASGKYFTFTCSAGPTATSYTLQAQGIGTMAGFTYTVTESNVKQTTSVPSGWTAPNPNTCWAIRKDGSC
jgi:type IV pilus assembly protein PilE